MSVCVWYVSKYATMPSDDNVGSRGFLLMRELVRMGHRAVIVTSDSNHFSSSPDLEGALMTETVDGVVTRWVRTLKYTGARSSARILSWFDFERRLWWLDSNELPPPDVIIVSSPSPLTIFNGLRLRRKHKCRLVFEVRDIWPLTLIEEGGFSRYNLFVLGLRWLEKMAYRRSDLIVGTMPNLKQQVVESIGDRHAPVGCIPFGVDADMIEKVKPPAADWVKKYVPPDKFIICHAGTIGVTNALEVLFDTARSMQDYPHIHFLIVGDGYLRPRFESECSDLPNVTFSGAVPRDMVQSVLALCDVTYFSVQRSRVWDYGLSLNKVIDYLLAGKPILASYTGYPTMVDEAGSGRSVPAGDAVALRTEILQLAAMPKSDRLKMGKTGRDWLLRNRPYRKLAEDYLRLIMPEQVANDDAGETHVRAG